MNPTKGIERTILGEHVNPTVPTNPTKGIERC